MQTSLTINGIDFNKELDLLLEYLKLKNTENSFTHLFWHYYREYGIVLNKRHLPRISSFNQYKQYKLKHKTSVECMSSSRTHNLIRSINLIINNCNSLKRLTAIAYTLC